MFDQWLRRHDPDRVFLVGGEGELTFGRALGLMGKAKTDPIVDLTPTLDFASIVAILSAMSTGTVFLSGPGQSMPTTADPGSAVTVMLTSGSSGAPKAVRHTTENWLAAAEASQAHLGYDGDDVWLLAMPLYHVGGLSIVVRSAYTGGTVRILPEFQPSTFAAALRGDVTMASVVPTMLSRLLDHDPGPYEGLRAVLVGGGPIPDGLLERASEARIPVLPTYGMTETCGQVATLRPGSVIEAKADPLPGVELRIGPDDRIALRCPMLSPGYLGEPDRERGGWFVTNDLGALDADGALRLRGRADTVIVTGGENVVPEIVEGALMRVDGIEDALVIGVADADWGEQVCCVYVGDVDHGALDSELRKSLPTHMIPKRWVRVDTIPVAGPGKPDRDRAKRYFN
ncbi:MAG: AMP-binding protein [Acidimicrobiia bacterium]